MSDEQNTPVPADAPNHPGVAEPLTQRNDNDAVQVGGAHVVDPNTGMATQTYSVPGTPNQTVTGFDEDQRSSREFEKNAKDNAADTLPQPNAHALAVPTSSPEVNYAARDNIVYPDARPGMVARVEAWADHLLHGVHSGVQVDAADRAKLGLTADEHRDAVADQKDAAREAVDGNDALSNG